VDGLSNSPEYGRLFHIYHIIVVRNTLCPFYVQISTDPMHAPSPSLSWHYIYRFRTISTSFIFCI